MQDRTSAHVIGGQHVLPPEPQPPRTRLKQEVVSRQKTEDEVPRIIQKCEIILHEIGDMMQIKVEDFKCIDLKRDIKVGPQNKSCLFNFSTANVLKLFSFAPYVVSGL